ncbi:MAG: hypothetical protein ABSG15_11265 [FCB group bacterium]|jgi:hypothetical protein
MTKVEIAWVQTSFDELQYEDEAPFFLFARGNSLIYIGLSFESSVRFEILSNIKRLELEKQGLMIFIGNIVKSNQKITRQLVEDCKCLLIYCNQPDENKQCKQNYDLTNHIDDLIINCQRTEILHKLLHQHIQAFRGIITPNPFI